jgi:hypothetical protein
MTLEDEWRFLRLNALQDAANMDLDHRGWFLKHTTDWLNFRRLGSIVSGLAEVWHRPEMTEKGLNHGSEKAGTQAQDKAV